MSGEDVLMSEPELLARFAAGDPGGVAEMYRTYGRLVYTLSYRVLGDASLAQDATRQTFSAARRLAAGVDPSHDFGPSLAAIAGRTATDLHHGDQEHRHDGNLDAAAGTAPKPVSPTPAADQIDGAWLVRKAIDALSDQDRELIRLQHSEKLTHTEIAQRFGIPLGRVKSRSHRAHHRLARLLGQLRAEDSRSR